ncbi:AraC family transcriptional regulator [Lachnospiraceae bacterium]|nr:AraC family transcriptional regulator [Lachnospiraceae bacterium]
MESSLLNHLKEISEEEKSLLSGEKNVQKNLYTNEPDFIVDSRKMLTLGKLIDIRPHTRFVHFPAHKHNYVEMIYMCSGATTHIINGSTTLTLNTGEILLLNPNTVHEILPAGMEDIAVNFIILPEFFDRVLVMLEEENVLRDFLIGALKPDKNVTEYLHFQSIDILPIRNLVENLIWSLLNSQPNRRNINQATMGLLFLHLLNHTDRINMHDSSQYGQHLVFTVLKYIETNYRTAELGEISCQLHMPAYSVSKIVKKYSGHTFKQLLQIKRLNQAAFLLSTTALPIEDIIALAGYDNTSYFHRIFKEYYHMTPRAYRNRVGE